MNREKLHPLFVSPPSCRPHGFWYVAGMWGCAFGTTLISCLYRYVSLKPDNSA